jgi:hypothetical protein
VVAIGSLLVLVVLSLVVTRIATMILVASGVSRTTARFQARSAFTGAGFTTSESEQVVDHPIRRKVIMQLMLLGHIGLVASASTLILGFGHGSAGHLGLTAVELLVGLFVLVYLSRSERFDRHLTRAISKLLHRMGYLKNRDLDTLVELPDHYALCELHVRSGDWLAGQRLGQLRLRDEGVEVVGITAPDHSYHANPNGQVMIEAGSTLVVHGHLDSLDELDSRRPGVDGEAEHRAKVSARGRADDHRPAG